MTGRGDAPPLPIVAGGVLALGSAVAFGATTPLVQRFGQGVGPFTTAALLYTGAALLSVVSRGSGVDAPLRRRDAPRLVIVAVLGAVVAPVALAWGLQRSSGVIASLLLSLEALFTVLLARALWAEHIGGRAAAALVAMTGGGVLLVAGGRVLAQGAGWGMIAVLVATLAWAADSVIARPLADRDPSHVVFAKSAFGAAASTALALVTAEAWPGWPAALALAGCGAVGYGLALRLYLGAQRIIGAARTGSIFAAAPFVGATLAWALGQRAGGAVTLAAGALCALGLWLQLTEGHEHAHSHEALEHDHLHGHDDGHHAHRHDVERDAQPAGEHSHPHRHETTTHVHPHGLDAHHRHRH